MKAQCILCGNYFESKLVKNKLMIYPCKWCREKEKRKKDKSNE